MSLFRSNRSRRNLMLFAVLLSVWGTPSTHAAVLSRNGEALLPVVVAPDATDSVRQSADVLAQYLGRIGGAEFLVEESDTPHGVSLLVAPDPDRPERYTITSSDTDVEVVGGSDLAVQHAVWDLLYRLGYRQYFATANWEIVPKLDAIEVDFDVDEEPDYRSRRVWYGYGTNSWNVEQYERWVARNRMGGAFELRTGHAWGGIMRRHADEFAAHPEWLALIDGERVEPSEAAKFCVSNEALRKLVVQDVLAQADADPGLDSISLDPTDGRGWCECQACAAIGSPSNRVILLANEAAAALEDAGHSRMWIGTYAYAGHARAPTIKPHPKVIVSVATAFSDRTADELLAEWDEAGVNQVGIREYHSVVTWDRNLPGRSRASNSEYLLETIPKFHGYGARFYSSESGDSWAAHGLGHFLSARLLWDVSEAERFDQIFNRFIEDCFGDAAAPMRSYFELVDGANNPLLSKDLIGRMYRLIQEARRMTSDAGVIARLNDLALFTRYVELMYAYRQGGAEEGIAVMQFAWKIRLTGMVHSYALYRDIPHRDKRIVVPEGAGANDRGSHPWKADADFTDADVEQLISRGIAANPLFDFTPRTFSGDLRPAGLGSGDLPLGSFGPRDRYDQSWLIWRDEPGAVAFQAQTGVIPSYREVRDTVFELHTIGQPIDGAVDEVHVRPDGETHDVTLETGVSGLHRLTSADAGAMTTLTFPDEMHVTREMSSDSPLHVNAGTRVVFYVPSGTEKIGGFAETDKPRVYPVGARWNEGRSVGPGYFTIDVPPGQDGMCWQIEVRSGGSKMMLMTVPPYVARRPDQLLLPQEVIDDISRTR